MAGGASDTEGKSMLLQDRFGDGQAKPRPRLALVLAGPVIAIEYVGQDALGALLANHPVRATFVSALVGLIPNCAASVAITELYLDGVLATGPMLAGLLASGGVGLLVLWRTNADARQNALITAFVYVVAVGVGLLVGASGMLF